MSVIKIPPISLLFYCDESSHNQPGYMGVGGIAIRGDRAKIVSNELQEICKAYSITTEIKWSKLKSCKFEAYKAVVDYFFSLHTSNLVHFHCLLADNTRFKFENSGDKKHILSRMYYQLVLHRCCRFYGKLCDLHIRHDDCNSLKDLYKYKAVLNEETGRRHGNDHEPIRTIQSQGSHTSYILQMNDLILGGIAYYKNCRHENALSAEAKKQMALYILGKIGVTDYEVNTPLTDKKFTVWNFHSTHYRKVSYAPSPRQLVTSG